MLRLGDFVLVVGLVVAWYLGTRPRYLGRYWGWWPGTWALGQGIWGGRQVMHLYIGG